MALQALLREGGFETEVRRVVSLGGDTDTNGAVAGALLGARDGVAALPSEWLSKLVQHDKIESEAKGLVALAERT